MLPWMTILLQMILVLVNFSGPSPLTLGASEQSLLGQLTNYIIRSLLFVPNIKHRPLTICSVS